MKVQCERCNATHGGIYGSGRFCSSKCSRGYATAAKRQVINAKVAKTLKGRTPSVSVEKRFQGGLLQRETKRRNLLGAEWDTLSLEAKKRRVLLEQNGKCLICGIIDWMGNPLRLQVDHEDGNRNNNARSNLRGVCPNCHSQTLTFCGRNRTSNKSLSCKR
jgi:hypothetical protein